MRSGQVVRRIDSRDVPPHPGRVTACFVALEAATGRVAGYYTLAAGGIPLAKMPAQFSKRLPRYPAVPVARLGRLAVALAGQGRKLGGALLWDAVERSMRSEVALYALVVDPKDEPAKNFYLHYGFVALGDTQGTLLLPLPKRK